MQKIIFIISGLSTGGAETMLFKLLDRINRDQFIPMVISLTSEGEIGPRIKALGIPVKALGIVPSFPNPLLFLRLAKLIRQFSPDIVHTWMYHADLLGGLGARVAGFKRIVWGIRHSNLSIDVNKRSTLAVVRLCAVLSHVVPMHILSCSKLAKEVHISIGYPAGKITVIPNGFDLKKFFSYPINRLAVRQELGLGPETPLVGLIGRFDPQKNHFGFIEAARLVHEQRPDVHFLMAGEGIDQHNHILISAIDQTGLIQNFHLLGRRDDMPRLMSALDVLASPSSGEAFSNVLGEAMASEVPCVVTDVGDSADIVGDTGRVVAAGDMAGLAAQILDLLSLPYVERCSLGKAARRRVSDYYEIGHVVRQYQNFYNTMSKDAL